MAKKIILNRFLNPVSENLRFTIESENVTFIKRFNIYGRKTKFIIKTIPVNTNPIDWIKDAIEEVVKYVTREVNPTDKIGITFCGESFQDRPAFLNFKTASDLKFDDIWDIILKVFQSNSEGLSTDKFCLDITYVKLPTGRGRTNKFSSYDEECKKKKGIIAINNTDNLCLPRAIVVSIAKVEKFVHYRSVLKNTGKLQTTLAIELTKRAGVIIPPDGCGITELKKYQELLTKYKIVVYKYGTRGRELIFKGTNDGKILNLLHHNRHYNVIGSLTAAFLARYYCEECHIPYYEKNAHRCAKSCPCCQKEPACSGNIKNILCEDCNRSFRGLTCLENHKASTSSKISKCEEIKKCKNCFKVFKTNRNHTCGEIFCKICQNFVPDNHLCYIQPNKNEEEKFKNFLYIFYDLETRQEKNLSKDLKQHEPNLCVIQQRCDICINIESLFFCQKCKFRTTIFEQEMIIEKLMEHILKLRKTFKHIVVIAHNGQAFDHQFVLNYVLTKTDLQPKLIMRGTKIILMLIDNIKFIDSLNYFPMSLAKLPKAFDLSKEFKKGYFPHLFNKKENENYIGCLPPMENYSPDNMKKDEYDEFLKWYEENKNSEFNFHKNFVSYCLSDVEILTEACLKFRKMFLEECNVEPFLEATTIASACNLLFRRNFLKANTIGLIPKNGYRLVDNHSKISLQWLIWEKNLRQIDIQCALNGKEKIIGGVKVDGFCEQTNEIFEFHGCYYHGHPKCLTTNRDKALFNSNDDTLNQRYERTLAKSQHLKLLGYNLIEMWECEFQEQMKINKNMHYLQNHSSINKVPLNPRDAFYGGRTGNIYSHYKCKPGEKIKYIDVCSLYPYVCKWGKFPIGHPKIYVGEVDCSKLKIDNIDGIIKCKILPPAHLLHPVLPLKQNDKLMFSLCRTCSEKKYLGEFCLHSDEERALLGTWIIDEVSKAVEKGYKLLEIYEIWEYETVTYNKNKNTSGLFTDMMNKFIKVKQEASGWPSKCVTNEEKIKYIEDFVNKEDVKLESTKINKNPGKRSLAKLILNSFWGKFGQKENQQKTKIINKSFELYDMLTDPAIEVNHIFPINEYNIVVSWQHKEEAAEPLPTVNVCIAAYTTAQARLKLYGYLEKLGKSVLYYDTDSVLYVSREGEYDPPTGEFIGDMTDELECYGPGSYITEFVSGGPKNYAYKIYSTKYNTEENVCKVKGICLNHTTLQKINFDTIKEAVLNSNNCNEIHVISQKIRRNKEHEVLTVQETKKYQPKSEKRKFNEDGSSVPYGYKRQKIQ